MLILIIRIEKTHSYFPSSYYITNDKAGEAIGKWQQLQPTQNDNDLDGCVQLPNMLELPFRRQPAPGKSMLMQ